MADEKNSFKEFWTADNVQKYILGTKKNGSPRALYDVIKDIVEPPKKGKKKKKKKDDDVDAYSFYMQSGKKRKKKHKKKGKKGKKAKKIYWHI